jgi:hypothetical protein
MSNILDQMVQSEQFVPATVDEYFALQLAKGLGDEKAVRVHVHYVEHQPPEHLIRLFLSAKEKPDPARAFHSSLTPSEP